MNCPKVMAVRKVVGVAPLRPVPVLLGMGVLGPPPITPPCTISHCWGRKAGPAYTEGRTPHFCGVEPSPKQLFYRAYKHIHNREHIPAYTNTPNRGVRGSKHKLCLVPEAVAACRCHLPSVLNPGSRIRLPLRQHQSETVTCKVLAKPAASSATLICATDFP
jgi:hypothetical protein